MHYTENQPLSCKHVSQGVKKLSAEQELCPKSVCLSCSLAAQYPNRLTETPPSGESLLHRSFVVALLSFSLLIFFASTVICTPAVHALSVTLAWDPNSPNEDVAGYNIYFGTESQNYTTVINVSKSTVKSVTKLKKGMFYYFAATAYNSYGAESSFSEEVMVNTCTYRISPSKKNFKATGGVGKIKVVTQPNCEWTASGGASWLTIMDGETGTGSGIITYSVEPNPDPDTRTVSSPFPGKVFTVTQKGTGI